MLTTPHRTSLGAGGWRVSGVSAYRIKFWACAMGLSAHRTSRHHFAINRIDRFWQCANPAPQSTCGSNPTPLESSRLKTPSNAIHLNKFTPIIRKSSVKPNYHKLSSWELLCRTKLATSSNLK